MTGGPPSFYLFGASLSKPHINNRCTHVWSQAATPFNSKEPLLADSLMGTHAHTYMCVWNII